MKRKRAALTAIPLYRKVLYSLLPAVFLFGSVEILLLLAGHSLSPDKWEENVFLRPHAKAIWRQGRWVWGQRIATPLNNLGLRGPDVALEPDQIRLLFLGDSITFGEGVRDEEAFPAVVERFLRDRSPRAALQVTNGGIPGYGIQEEQALARSLVAVIRPQLVLLTFCVNDVFDILKQRSPEEYARYERERFSSLFFLSATTRHLFMRYFLFLYTNGLSSPKINGLHPLQQESPDVREAWAAYFSGVRALAAFVQEHGAELGVIVFPDFSQVVTGIDTPERRFLAFGRELDIPVLLLLDAFRKRRHEGPPLLIPDGHPNAHAHEIIASTVVDWLVGSTDPPPFPGVLPPGTPTGEPS